MRGHADVVVVGGGSSGAVVAGRLAEAGVDVVLLEAGPDYGPFGSTQWPHDLLNAHEIALSHDWGYGSGPVDGREPWTFERAKVIGGCSAHNGAIAAVGHASDYDAWGLAEWRTDVLRPFFATALERMRVRAYQPSEASPFHARCLEAAVGCRWTIASDLCDLDANESFGLETVNIVDRIRWNTAFAYLDRVRTRSNLTVTDMTIVDRIVARPDGVTVIAWRYGQPVTIDADRVVLSAGVYGTPAILQRSGIGDPKRLAAAGVRCVHQLRGVGANLHDHPMVGADRELGAELRSMLADIAARGELPEEQTLGKACSSIAKAGGGIFDLHVYPVCSSTQTALTNGCAIVAVACMTPRSRGRVDIVSADRSTPPQIDHGYLSDADGHDIAVLRDGLAMAEELLGHPALASMLGERVTDLSTDDAIRRHVVHYYHPVGTCRMGSADDPDAACGPDGSVIGLDRVTVADVSLMPQIPRANTNIPAVMIGERIASMLLARS
jgi:choline dehydrogenase